MPYEQLELRMFAEVQINSGEQVSSQNNKLQRVPRSVSCAVLDSSHPSIRINSLCGCSLTALICPPSMLTLRLLLLTLLCNHSTLVGLFRGLNFEVVAKFCIKSFTNQSVRHEQTKIQR